MILKFQIKFGIVYAPLLSFSAKHRSYISKRKIEALDMDIILKDLKKSCNCGLSCTATLDPMLVLRFRRKVHLLVHNTQRRIVLLDLYRDSMYIKNNINRHHVEQSDVCRYDSTQFLSKSNLIVYWIFSTHLSN